MKGLILSTILSSLLSHGVHKAPQHLIPPPQLPEKCPSISAMASQGLDHVSPYLLLNKGAWVGVKENSNYDTNDSWTFVVLQMNGDKNGRVAIQQLSSRIQSLQVAGGPLWDEDAQVAACVYKDDLQPDSEVFGIAFTPPSYS